MSISARRRLALVIAVAMVIAMVAPATGLARVHRAATSAGVGAATIFAPDAYESADDTQATAPTLPSVSLHTFESSTTDDYYATDDVDWFKVTVTATGTPIFLDTRWVSGPELCLQADLYKCDASGNPTGSAVDSSDYYDDFDGYGYATTFFYKADAPGVYKCKVYPTHGRAFKYYTYVTLGDARRISGADRYQTALEVSKFLRPETANYHYWDDGVDGIVVASGASFADALAGGVLALQNDSPVLLTAPTALPSGVAAEIERLVQADIWEGNSCTVYILGGTSAVSSGVETSIKAIPGVTKVTRLGGTTRFGTAAAIANETSQVAGGLGDTAFLVNGLNFADALAAGPVAGYGEYPILMTSPTSAASETVNWMKTNLTKEVIVCGGTSAIATSVLDAIQASVPDTQTFTRIAGADRYETAQKLAQYGVDNYSMEGSRAVLVSGLNFPDGLAAAPLTTLFYDCPILLTPPTALSSRVESFYAANDGFAYQGYVVGGSAAISDTTFAAFRDLWKKPF